MRYYIIPIIVICGACSIPFFLPKQEEPKKTNESLKNALSYYKNNSKEPTEKRKVVTPFIEIQMLRDARPSVSSTAGAKYVNDIFDCVEAPMHEAEKVLQSIATIPDKTVRIQFTRKLQEILSPHNIESLYKLPNQINLHYVKDTDEARGLTEEQRETFEQIKYELIYKLQKLKLEAEKSASSMTVVKKKDKPST